MKTAYKRLDDEARAIRDCIRSIYDAVGVSDQSMTFMRKMFGSPWAMPVSPEEIHKIGVHYGGGRWKEWLAHEFGVSIMSVERWVRGQFMPRLEAYHRLVELREAMNAEHETEEAD